MGTYQDAKDLALKSIGRLPDPTIQGILKKRMGLETGKAQTLEEVGQAFGLTNKQVLRKERVGLNQLRRVGIFSPQEAEAFRNSEIGQRLLGSLRKALSRIDR